MRETVFETLLINSDRFDGGRSWLNQVEIWFSILQGQSLRGASFTSVKQLREHIDAFIEAYNAHAKPFVWTKSQSRFKDAAHASLNHDSFIRDSGY